MNLPGPSGIARQALHALMIAAALGGVAGCQLLPCCQPPMEMIVEEEYQPVNVLVSHHYGQLKPRRVVIATPISRAHLLPEQKAFAQAFATSLSHAGFADAVVAQPCRCDIKAIRKGKIDLQQLVDLSIEYSADAVLYCDVISFSAYSPMHVSASLILVDARESVTLMALDGNWDVRDPSIETGFLRYLSSYRGDNDFKSKIKFQSPSEFIKYASRDLATFMSRQ